METAPPPPSQTTFPTILGVICLAIGLLTFWAFGLGFLFLFGALAIAITALIKTQAKQGLILLVFSAASFPLCGLLFLVSFPFWSMISIRSYQQKRINSFLNPSLPTPHRPFFLAEHSFATQTTTSPDGEAYIVIDDSDAVCSSIRIDGELGNIASTKAVPSSLVDMKSPATVELGQITSGSSKVKHSM